MSAPTIIQHASGASGSATFGSPVTQGNLLLAFGQFSSTLVPSEVITDSQGNNWQVLQQLLGWNSSNFDSESVALWFAVAKSSATPTITLLDGDLVACAECSASSVDIASVLAAAGTANP